MTYNRKDDSAQLLKKFQHSLQTKTGLVFLRGERFRPESEGELTEKLFVCSVSTRCTNSDKSKHLVRIMVLGWSLAMVTLFLFNFPTWPQTQHGGIYLVPCGYIASLDWECGWWKALHLARELFIISHKQQNPVLVMRKFQRHHPKHLASHLSRLQSPWLLSNTYTHTYTYIYTYKCE